MAETVYVCTGSCQGVATEEQWEAGAKTCAAEDCELHGEPLQKRLRCEDCQEIYMPGEEHECG